MDIKKLIKIVLVFAGVIVTAMAIRFYVSRKGVITDSGYYEVMGTIAHMVVLAPDKNIGADAVEAAFAELNAVNEMMSTYIPDSELSDLNRNGHQEPVKVSDDLFEVISTALKYSEMTNGAFDVTVKPLIELWKKAERENRKPTDEQIADARSKVGYEKIILDEANKTIKFAVEGMSIDLGAIAKGYAIDKAVNALKARGATSAMIDVGGDIRCFGEGTGKKGQTGWRIGLQDPKADAGLLLVLKLKDRAVATSGDYRRYVVIEGQHYSHIFNPKAGISTTDLTSVSVIAETAMQADILATSISVMGAEKGLALIEPIENTEAILIPAGKDMRLLHSTKVGRYIDTSADISSQSMASRMITQQKNKDTEEK